MMKPCMFDDCNSTTLLCLPDLFKRSYDSIEISEEMPLWILPNFVKEGPRVGFNNLLVLTGVFRNKYARPKKCNVEIGSYVEAAIHLLKSNAVNANIFKATSEIGWLLKLENESTVQFADAVHLKTVRCGNRYPYQRTIEVHIDGLPLTTRSGVHMF